MVGINIFSKNAKKMSTKEAVVIDYPKNGESINSACYTFRISTNFETQRVEVTINGISWNICRQSAGFWWFDWKNFTPKNYLIQARAISKNGTRVTSAPRNFKVAGKKV